jgi:hypothetical protein
MQLFTKIDLPDIPQYFQYFEDNGNYNSPFDETLLTAREKFINQLTPEQIEKIVVHELDTYHSYSDEYGHSAIVDIYFTSNDILSINFIWQPADLSCFKYLDSKTAILDIIKLLQDEISDES